MDFYEEIYPCPFCGTTEDLDVVLDKDNLPIFVGCHCGKERTSLEVWNDEAECFYKLQKVVQEYQERFGDISDEVD